MSGKTHTRYDAHGWTTTRVTMPRGEAYSLVLGQDALHSELSITAFYTKGRVLGRNTNTGAMVLPRTPGVLTQSLGAITAGTYEFRAEEDSEWWCFDKKLNQGQLPLLTRVQMTAGQEANFLPQQRLLLCAGVAETTKRALNVGDTVQLTALDKLIAKSPILVLLFDRSLF